MIDIKNLYVSVWEKEILKGVSLRFELGKNYCILGKNGSGKSTLSSVLMGHPKYEVTAWSIEIYTPGQAQDLSLQDDGRGESCAHPTESKNFLEMEPNERASAGIFLSFQNVPEIKGVKLSEYLRTIFNISKRNEFSQTKALSHSDLTPSPSPQGEGSSGFTDVSPFMFRRYIKKYLEELHIEESFLDRDLNVGFSGGEKRKIEILQMKLIGPKYIILDEIDSGLDLDAFKTVATMLQSLSSPENTFIIITHYFTILDYIDVNTVYVMQDGNVIKTGGKELVDEIKEKGFGEF